MLFAALLASPIVSASGQLDPRFEGDGVRVIDAAESLNLNDRLRAGLIDSEGRFVGAGHARFGDGFAGSVIRVGATGTLDTSFANGGISYIQAFDGEQALFWIDIVEQPDGKLVVAGNSSLGNVQVVHVCRLLSNGALDPSFAGDGCAQPSLWFDSSRDQLASMVLQPDGRILLLGTTDFDGIGAPDYAVARLDADGSFEPCFGDATCQGGGVVIEPGSDVAARAA